MIEVPPLLGGAFLQPHLPLGPAPFVLPNSRMKHLGNAKEDSRRMCLGLGMTLTYSVTPTPLHLVEGWAVRRIQSSSTPVEPAPEIRAGLSAPKGS